MNLFVVAAVFFIDTFTKRTALKNIAKREVKKCAFAPVYFTTVENSGFAKNILSGSPKRVKIISALALIFAALYSAYGLENSSWLAKAGYSAMLGGGISNLYDRMAKGSVTDFICFKRGRTTVYNIADFCIFSGAFVFAVCSIFRR